MEAGELLKCLSFESDDSDYDYSETQSQDSILSVSVIHAAQKLYYFNKCKEIEGNIKKLGDL